MISINQMEQILNELAEELPEEFYSELNGGIILLPQAKRNKEFNTSNLYIMGEYHKGGNLGRYITIYYGSFANVYGNLDAKLLKKHLRKTLRHEFRHHMESLSGERGLEIEDAKYIAKYRKKINNKPQ